MITKSIVDLNLIASFANAFEMPFVTPWFPEKTGGGFIPTTVFFHGASVSVYQIFRTCVMCI